MTIDKEQRTFYSIITATESERQILRDLFDACTEVSEDDNVYVSFEEILTMTISDLIRLGKTDLSNFYMD